jgi:hypothetical protein
MQVAEDGIGTDGMDWAFGHDCGVSHVCGAAAPSRGASHSGEREERRIALLGYDSAGRFRKMTTIAITVLAAIALAGPSLSVADGKPANTGSKPSSYTPQPRTNNHIYGAPIQSPIVGHAKASRHKHARRKASTSATTRDATKAPVHHNGKTPAVR